MKKKDQTFIVKIYGREHTTWQGSVEWMQGKQSVPFRSVLELINLMNSALSEDEEAEDGRE